jgi:uncharacterized membrane protein
VIDDEGGFDAGKVEVTEAEIAQELGGLIPADKKDAVVRRVTKLIQRSHRGPLPAPEDFAHYDQTLPGGAERIMCLTEKEQDHRHRIERRLVLGEYGVRFLGQFAALFSLMVVAALVAFCAYVGQPLTASLLGACGAIVIAFLKYSSNAVDKSKKPQGKQVRKRK